jgi:hypothetical protein
LWSLLIGFAVAGLFATGYQLLTSRPASFRLLAHESSASAFASIPFLVFAAPFIIMRNTVRKKPLQTRDRFGFAMVATLIAGFWSLMSGTVVVMALETVDRILPY